MFISFDLFLVVVQELTRAINNKKKYFVLSNNFQKNFNWPNAEGICKILDY